MTKKERQTSARAGSELESSLVTPVLVLGVGNILLGDEGVGVHIIRAMQLRERLTGVELLDGGTLTLDILDSLADRDKVIIIDAVKGGGQPGTVYRFTPNDIAMQSHNPFSLHQISLLEMLKMAELTDCIPRDIVILGIEPKVVDWGLELSQEVAAQVPKVIELVLGEL